MAGYADERALIENMSNRYMIAMDAGDIDTIVNSWSEDGVMDWVFGVEHGREEIRAAMQDFAGMRDDVDADASWAPRTRHQIVNHVIDIDGDTASTIAYWFALTNRTPQNDVQTFYFGHYEAELVKEDGRWVFTSRKVFNESRQNRAAWYPNLGEPAP
jgi:ketosteroid isomerase-like protein